MRATDHDQYEGVELWEERWGGADGAVTNKNHMRLHHDHVCCFFQHTTPDLIKQGEVALTTRGLSKTDRGLVITLVVARIKAVLLVMVVVVVPCRSCCSSGLLLALLLALLFHSPCFLDLLLLLHLCFFLGVILTKNVVLELSLFHVHAGGGAVGLVI